MEEKEKNKKKNLWLADGSSLQGALLKSRLSQMYFSQLNGATLVPGALVGGKEISFDCSGGLEEEQVCLVQGIIKNIKNLGSSLVLVMGLLSQIKIMKDKLEMLGGGKQEYQEWGR